MTEINDPKTTHKNTNNGVSGAIELYITPIFLANGTKGMADAVN